MLLKIEPKTLRILREMDEFTNLLLRRNPADCEAGFL